MDNQHPNWQEFDVIFIGKQAVTDLGITPRHLEIIGRMLELGVRRETIIERYRKLVPTWSNRAKALGHVIDYVAFGGDDID